MKIFLGYPSEHVSEAREIFTFLRSAGLDAWFDKDALTGGDEWELEIERAQHGADMAIHLISQAQLNRSGIVNKEIRRTLDRNQSRAFGRAYAIFIRLEDYTLPLELSRFHYVDYFRRGWQDELIRIIDKNQDTAQSGKVELLRISDENRYGRWEKIEFIENNSFFEGSGNYIRYLSDELYWTLINSNTSSHVLGEFFGFRSDVFANYAEPQEEDTKSTIEINSDVFFESRDIVSLRFYNYFGWARAAHPNHHVTSLNFLGESRGKVEIQYLFANNDDTARKVLKAAERIIVASLDGVDGFTFDDYTSDITSVWSLISQYNVDSRGLTINISPYQVLPYVYGIHEALIPWHFLEGDLSETFVDLPSRLRASDQSRNQMLTRSLSPLAEQSKLPC
jgi:hypothetical protein